MADSGDLARSVRAALQRVINPRTGADVVSSEQIRNIEVDDDAKVHLQFVLVPTTGSLVKDARSD
jgi:metal-sulfur cluster biosynthetic enzyme